MAWENHVKNKTLPYWIGGAVISGMGMTEPQKNPARYIEITKGIRISVIPEPLEEQCDPNASVYTFLYTITIENVGDVPAQLVERHWHIFSGDQKIAEVVGPGVVGVQPRVSPGEAFQYQSSAVIQEPIGSMHGSYTFRTDDGEFFEVAIPQFDLIYSYLFH
jgi:ApaG protein